MPRNFSPTGDYTDRWQELAIGFRLLAHAEFEFYLEESSKKAIIGAVKSWKVSRSPTPTIVALLASYHSAWYLGADDEDTDKLAKILVERKRPKNKLNSTVEQAQAEYLHKVQENHGIKKKNLFTLLLPVGVDIDLLDHTWLTNLDEYGKKRGEFAHTTRRVQTTINPKEEYDSAIEILDGFAVVDQQILELTHHAN